MIEKLVIQKLTIAGKEYEYQDTTAIVGKINELADAVNELQTKVNKLAPNINFAQPEVKENVQELAKKAEKECRFNPVQADREVYKALTRAENVRPPYMQNKRLRKALGIAQSALVKLANDAYDMDEHIYIDKILNQIERITKGGDYE